MDIYIAFFHSVPCECNSRLQHGSGDSSGDVKIADDRGWNEEATESSRGCHQ